MNNDADKSEEIKIIGGEEGKNRIYRLKISPSQLQRKKKPKYPRSRKNGRENISYEAELTDSDRRECPHFQCRKIMIVSDTALKGYNRRLRVITTNGKYCPYCGKEIPPLKKKK